MLLGDQPIKSMGQKATVNLYQSLAEHYVEKKNHKLAAKIQLAITLDIRM